MHIVPNQCNEMHGAPTQRPARLPFDNDEAHRARRQGDRQLVQDPGLAIWKSREHIVITGTGR